MNAPIAPSIVTVQTVVTRPRGSWRWQDAYAVSTYAWTGCAWRFVGRSRKLSMPQLRRLFPDVAMRARPVGAPVR